MKSSKEPIKKSSTTERKKIFINKSVDNIKLSNYSTIQEEEESPLIQIAYEEYKDLFPEILLLSKKDFFASLEKYIQISLATSDKIYPTGALNKTLFLIEKKYYNNEKEKIEKKTKMINLSSSTISYLTYTENNFTPHCQYTKEAFHTCGEKLINIMPKYYYCAKCKLVYNSECILLKCDKCNIEYYTEIEEESKENYMMKKSYLKPATWAKYHCNALINDTMRCSKCQNCLYLNMRNNLLYCMKCDVQMSQYEIKWKCILCKQLFTSKAKIYNKYEYKIMSMTIKKTLFKGIEAKPKYIPCCNIYGEKVKSYKYLHKSECSGILYEGELNNKKIVVCSKCHMLNYYENQYWFCPICKIRFHFQIKDNNVSCFDSPKNIHLDVTQNKKIFEDKETIGKKEVYHKKRKNNLSIELKKHIFNLCEKEQDKNENKNEADIEKDRSSIIDLKKRNVFSVRHKQKKINFNNNYSNNCLNSNENSHIIFSNYKKLNSKNSMEIRFQTIQDNHENREKEKPNEKQKDTDKEKEKENENEKEEDKEKVKEKNNIPMTNDKNNEVGKNSKFNINNNFNKSHSKLFSGISRNITNMKNIYPPHLLHSGLSPNPSDTEIKSNYKNFIKNNQPTMFKHHKTKYSYDQYAVPIPTCSNKNISNKNSEKKIDLDKIMSKNEIKEKIISELEFMNAKDEISNIDANLFNNRIRFSKFRKKRILSLDEKPSLINNPNPKDNIIQNTEKKKEIRIILKDRRNLFKKENNENDNQSTIEKKIKAFPISITRKETSFNSDDFNIIKQIGQGSFGKILEVEDKYHRRFAMKKIIACSLKEVDLIKSEYNILYELSNLNINLIGIYGIETKKLDRTTYAINVLMELAISDWEKEIMKRNQIKNFYNENELIIILKKLVNTFATLQKVNVSHRDIKPQNILLCQGGELKIADFGEAKKIINKNNNNTIKQTIRGTELYMSPILFYSLRNKLIYKYTKHNTYKSDVFSLGYCMLLATTLNYKLLCEIREVKNMNGIQKIIKKYTNKGLCIYSDNYWNILYSMLELDERNRPDFIELAKIVENL